MQACTYCHTEQQAASLNLLPALSTDKMYCDDCFYAMGMRRMASCVYVHVAPDTLFVGAQANHPASPLHDPCFGPVTPLFMRQVLNTDANLRRAVDECLSEHGRSVSHEERQPEATALLNRASPEEMDLLVRQGCT